MLGKIAGSVCLLAGVAVAAHAGMNRDGRALLAGVPLSFEARGAGAVARGEGLQASFTGDGVELAAAGASKAIWMRFVGANRAATIALEQRQSHQANYFSGTDRTRWRTNVPQFGKLRYSEVYSGIDLVFYGQRNVLEYDFVVRPGADTGSIGLVFEGAGTLRLDAAGGLRLSTRGGEIVHRKPVAYQLRNGQRRAVDARYRLAGNTVRFELGPYDRALPLVIDPVLQYSTYLGGSTPVNAAADAAYAVALDANDNIYVVGRTVAADFPLKDEIQGTNNGSGDAFIIKLDPAGQEILYATYLGGTSLEYAYAIAVDADGQAHVAGQTGSANFPLKNAMQTKIGGLNDAFLLKLNAAGNELVFSTLFGGERNEQLTGVGLDQFGNVYAGGYTGSTTLPVKDAMQPKLAGSSDGFLCKFTPEGELVYSTFVGGPGQDEIYAIAVDQAGNTYATGFILSAGLATENAAQTKMLSRDAFVAKVTSDGQAFQYFTYLGGHGTDYGNAIAIDPAGNAYIGGYTDSKDLPALEHAFQPELAGNSDAFVAAVDPDGLNILWSTYLGGTAKTNSDEEVIRALAVDPDGCVYVTGTTKSSDFPLNRETQKEPGGGRDAFVAKIAPAGDQLIFSTYLGGQGQEDAMGIAVSPLRSFVIAGQTFSDDLPLEKPLLEQRGSTSDAMVARICDPVMFLSEGALEFTFVQGGEPPVEQVLRVAACKNLELTVEVSEDATWLSASKGDPGEGVSPVTVAVSAGELEPGDYEARVTVSAPDVFFGPVPVPVVLHVVPPPPPPTEETPEEPVPAPDPEPAPTA